LPTAGTYFYLNRERWYRVDPSASVAVGKPITGHGVSSAIDSTLDSKLYSEGNAFVCTQVGTETLPFKWDYVRDLVLGREVKFIT
jgi:hypothetical protein